MNAFTSIARAGAWGLIATSLVALASCRYYEVPITPKPTGKMDARLLGEWVCTEGMDSLKVVKLDDSTYQVTDTSGHLHRAWRSDVGGKTFVTVQDLHPWGSRYSYWAWKISPDGKLTLNNINGTLIPYSARSSMEVVNRIKENLKNPSLLADEMMMQKE